jgi:glycosyltransferase involved in cell wall biosynthesis
VVISERNDPARERLDRLWNGLRPLLYRHADLVTANSRHAVDWMRRYVPERKLRLIPNPLGAAYLSGDGSVLAARSSRIMLSVGRLHRQKGHDLLLRAFAALPPALGAWRLVVAGEGEERGALAALAESLGVAGRVRFAGFVADPRVLYREAALFVLASRYEGMSNALLEAMSQGLPAVVADTCPGSLELVADGVSGLVVPGGDPAALRDALARLARDEALRAALGRAARERSRTHDLGAVMQQWEQVLAP